MRFKSILGFLDVDVIEIDRIEGLPTKSKPQAIYVNRRFSFVIGWNTKSWFLWELPKNGEEVFEQTSDKDKTPVKPENLWIPISISSRYQWDNFVPSVNVFVHELKKDIKLEDYIRENLQILVGQKKVKFVESGTGLAPNEYVGFSTLFTETEGRKIYQLQKFVKRGKRVYTISASNIFEGLPTDVKGEIAEIMDSFAFIGQPPRKSNVAVGGLKGVLGYLGMVFSSRKRSG